MDLAIRTSPDNIVGSLTFYEDEENRIRLSYFVLPSERRKGYAREAYKTVIEKFAEMQLAEELYADVAVDNIASNNFLKGFGFQKEDITAVGSPESSLEGKEIFVYRKRIADFLLSSQPVDQPRHHI